MAVIRILFVGEIVGKSGVWCVKELLPKLKKDHAIDFVIADGEGATGGFGIGKNHAVYLHKLGINVITTGECCYYKKDIVDLQKAKDKADSAMNGILLRLREKGR